MSLKAITWAFELDDARLTPVAKLVLLAIADAAREEKDFECDVRHETLARKAHVSSDTSQRRVKELCALGYIFVMKRRGDDGCKISNRYIVLLNERARRHALANGWDGVIGDDPDDETNFDHRSLERTEAVESDPSKPQSAAWTRPQGERNQAAPETEPSRTAAATERTLTVFNNTPPTPLRGEGEGFEASLSETTNGDERDNRRRSAKADVDGARLARWGEFKRLWPWDATELPGEARVVFMGLADDEQSKAVAAAPGYAAACKTRETRARNHGMVHAKKWLANEGWITAKARSVDSAASIAGMPFPVRQASPQSAAWAEYETRLYGKPRIRFFESKQLGMICMRPTEWPPRAPTAGADGPPATAPQSEPRREAG